MLHIYCPYCEEMRTEEEFTYGGEAHIVRPLDPPSLTDAQWADYLFCRSNPRGMHHEMWHHTAGCRRFFNVTRDTETYVIHETYQMGRKTKITHGGANEPT
jgi:sarcosine oxidase subunit delta